MSRKNVSNRRYLDASGNKSVGPDPSGSVCYDLLNSDGTVLKTWQWQGDQCSQFGFVTKVGNVANSVLNGDDAGTPTDAAADVDDFVAGLTATPPVWREKSEGGTRGPKYTTDILAAVLVTLLGTAAKGDAAHYQARLDGDKKYRAQVVARDDVKAAYWAEAAKRGVTKPATATDSLA